MTTTASELKSLGQGPEPSVLLGAVLCALFNGPPVRVDGATDWRQLLELARLNKLGVPLMLGLRKSGVEPPEEARRSLEQYNNSTVMLNSANLATVREIMPHLVARGIEVSVFKGPLQQLDLYRTPFMKPAGDVDLLVGAEDFRRAAQTISQLGFQIAPTCASPWWRFFLGEQHFTPGRRGQVTVDLHHRVQQPGAPAPRVTAAFIQHRRMVQAGDAAIPMFSEAHAFLHSSMSVVKAIGHREAAAGYVCDVAMAALRAGEALPHYLHAAEAQGLMKTVAFSLQCAEALFGLPAPRQASAVRPFQSLPNSELLLMVMRPQTDSIHWPRRRRILWELCDHKFSYLREMPWALGGEVCRRAFEPPVPAAA